VPAYLVTKGIAAGLFLILAGGMLSGSVPFAAPAVVAVGLLVLLFLGATTVLLVADLERPERFLRVITMPHTRSWLVRGAWILIAFSTLAGVWWLLELAGWLGWTAPPDALRPWLLGAGIPLAGLTATYTAFLFGQAEGRDLWQSPLLPAHLLVQAVMAGGAALLLLNLFVPLPGELRALAWWAFASALVVDLLVLLPGEFGMSHQTDGAREAAHAILHGPWRRHFWVGAVLVGHLLPLALLGGGALLQALGFGTTPTGGDAVGPWPVVAGGMLSCGLAGALSLVGLYLYEHAYVMAPQNVRNS
jgi:formate-dependent nitrite reductase membrane component NrfD